SSEAGCADRSLDRYWHLVPLTERRFYGIARELEREIRHVVVIPVRDFEEVRGSGNGPIQSHAVELDLCWIVSGGELQMRSNVIPSCCGVDRVGIEIHCCDVHTWGPKTRH